MAVDSGQMDLRSIARGIEDTEVVEPAQLRGDLGTETTVSEPQVEDGQIGL